MEPSMPVRKSVLLAVAFAALLVVIGGSAFAVWRNSATAQARVAALHNAHLEAGNALASIRANVYLTGILTRDYLLDPDPSHARQYADQFLNIRSSTEESFRTLESSAQNAEEKTALQQLRREVDTHLDPARIVLDWAPNEKNARRGAFLQERLRRREEIVALAAQVERMVTENFSTEREHITKADQDFRSSLAWTTGVALLLGLAIAGVTLVRMTALERRSQMAETELRRLSGQVRTAQEQERKNLSRELHDEVGQMLTGLRMELGGMSRLSGDPESELALRVDRAKGIVEATLGIIRNIAMLLRPSMLDDLGLTPALAWLAKETSRSSGMEIVAKVDPALNELPETYRTCLYRVAQEGITNISKHAGAHKVDIALKLVGDWVVGTISDDGCGFDPHAIRPGGLGLMGMEERLRELNGHLRVISTLGDGTRLEFRLPVPNHGKEMLREQSLAQIEMPAELKPAEQARR
jgi:signal transduction histidine kinase